MIVRTIFMDKNNNRIGDADGTMPFEKYQKLYDTDSFREVIDVKPFFSQKRNETGTIVILTDPMPIDSPLAGTAYIPADRLQQLFTREHAEIQNTEPDTYENETTHAVRKQHFITELRAIKKAINQEFGIKL